MAGEDSRGGVYGENVISKEKDHKPFLASLFPWFICHQIPRFSIITCKTKSLFFTLCEKMIIDEINMQCTSDIVATIMLIDI